MSCFLSRNTPFWPSHISSFHGFILQLFWRFPSLFVFLSLCMFMHTKPIGFFVWFYHTFSIVLFVTYTISDALCYCCTYLLAVFFVLPPYAFSVLLHLGAVYCIYLFVYHYSVPSFLREEEISSVITSSIVVLRRSYECCFISYALFNMHLCVLLLLFWISQNFCCTKKVSTS